FSGVAHDASGDTQNEPRVAVEEDLQRVGVVGLQTGHRFVIAGKVAKRGERSPCRRFPSDWKRQCPPWWRRTHFWSQFHARLTAPSADRRCIRTPRRNPMHSTTIVRSEEHTSELQSLTN